MTWPSNQDKTVYHPVVLLWQLGGGGGGARVEVTVPELSYLAIGGRIAFDANCVQCHGNNAAGSDRGPPLVHEIYSPGQHGDDAFYAAAMLGAVQHHWRYGHMPAQPQVDEDTIAAVVQYVRELQYANGIDSQ